MNLGAQKRHGVVKVCESHNSSACLQCSQDSPGLTTTPSDAEPSEPEPDGGGQFLRPGHKFGSFEEVLDVVGVFGPLQVIFTICAQLCVLCWAGNYVFLSFALIEPMWKCNSDGSSDDHSASLDEMHLWNSTQKCDLLRNCPGGNITVHSHQFFSIVEDWQLYCDQAYVPSLITTIQMIGSLLGSQFCGYLSDHYGRKLIFLVTFIGLALSGSLSVLSFNWHVMAIFRGAIGFFLYGSLNVNFIWCMEMTDTKHSFIMNVASFWEIAYMVCALIGFVIPNWRLFSIAVNLVAFPLIAICLFTLPESPRWLIQRKRFAEASVGLRKMAALNGVKNFKIEAAQLQLIPTDDQQKHYTALHLCANSRISIFTAITTLSSFTVSCIENMFIYKVGNLNGNPFLNLFLFGLLRTPIPFLAFWLDKKFLWFGRRLVFLGSLLVICVFFGAVILCFSLQIDDELQTFITVFALLGSVFCSCLWIGIGQYSVELFPTVVRNIASGFVSFGDSVGGIVAPNLFYLESTLTSMPYVVTVGVCVTNFIAGFFWFPETKGKLLPDTLEELNDVVLPSKNFKTRLKKKHRKVLLSDQSSEKANGSDNVV